jgi:hypothetical protein
MTIYIRITGISIIAVFYHLTTVKDMEPISSSSCIGAVCVAMVDAVTKTLMFQTLSRRRYLTC